MKSTTITYSSHTSICSDTRLWWKLRCEKKFSDFDYFWWLVNGEENCLKVRNFVLCIRICKLILTRKSSISETFFIEPLQKIFKILDLLFNAKRPREFYLNFLLFSVQQSPWSLLYSCVICSYSSHMKR